MNSITAHRLLAALTLSLILALSLQTAGRTAMDIQMTFGQSAMTEIADHCDGCIDTDAAAADCLDWSCTSASAAISMSNGLATVTPATILRSPPPHFHLGLTTSPDPQPPRDLRLI